VSEAVTISVLEKDYVVSCPPGEEEALRESARVLHERMSVARDAGKALGTERIAVVTALNIVHEFLTLDTQRRENDAKFAAHLARLERKIGASLGRRSDTDQVD
jgi:cell division protein ZapA